MSLLRNRWDGLTSVNPFDPKSGNWNGIVIGGSGSGKTFLMQTLLGDLLRGDTDVMIIDRGYGYKPLVELFDGEIIPVEPGSSVSINPFDLPKDIVIPDSQKKGFLLTVLRAMLPSEGGVTESLENAIMEQCHQPTICQSTEHKGARRSPVNLCRCPCHPSRLSVNVRQRSRKKS